MTKAGSAGSMVRTFRLLCVDDNELGLYVNAVILRSEGYDVLACSDVSKATAVAEKEEIDLAILDYQMPAMNGAELAAFCKAVNPDVKVILFSGSLCIPKRELALADLFVPKSEGIIALLKGIEALLPRAGMPASFASTSSTATSA